MHDATQRVAVRADERGPMQVGPDGEGERAVLLRMLCAVAGGAFGALFAAAVVGNVDRHLTYAGLGVVFVTIVPLTVFLPEVSRLATRRRRRS
jgi:hypothetical protein